jgi:hypothetical protein
MRKDIDLFLNDMENVLSADLIAHIITTYIYKDRNMKTIQKQKKAKSIVCKELIEFYGLCYSNQGFSLYRNQQNQIILKNYQPHTSFLLYSERDQLIRNQQSSDNEMVLFNNQSNPVYDDNGIPVQKKIKLYIMYI